MDSSWARSSAGAGGTSTGSVIRKNLRRTCERRAAGHSAATCARCRESSEELLVGGLLLSALRRFVLGVQPGSGLGRKTRVVQYKKSLEESSASRWSNAESGA